MWSSLRRCYMRLGLIWTTRRMRKGESCENAKLLHLLGGSGIEGDPGRESPTGRSISRLRRPGVLPPSPANLEVKHPVY
jgi:hypothetical protein